MDRVAAQATFLRAVDAGSFSRAAHELGLTQPTVSKQVAWLEAHLGVQLMVRSTRALSLTEEGARYAEALRAAMDALEAAEAAARGTARAHGTLRLGCPVSFGQAQIVPRLAGFLDAHPEVSVDLRMSDAFLDPVEQGVDLVIRVGALADSALRARRIGTTRRLVVAAPGYVEARGAPREPRDLAEHECLIYTRLATGSDWPFVGEGGRPVAVRVGGRVRADNSAAMRGAVLAGLGVGLLPAWLVGADVTEGRLVRLMPGHEPEPLPIHALTPAQRHVAPRTRAFSDHMARALAADPHAR